MKNKIYYLGLASLIIITAGAISKLFHWPGAGIMLTIGVLMLSTLFIPAALVSNYKSDGYKKYKFLYILIGIVFAVDFIGMLFKLMHWPGAGYLVLISLPLPFILVLPVYLFTVKDEKELNYKNFMAVMFFFAYFAAISGLLATGVSRNVIDGYVYSAISLEQRTNIVNQQCLEKYSKALSDKSIDSAKLIRIDQIVKQADKVCNSVDNVMLEFFNKKGKEPVITSSFIWNIKIKDGGISPDITNSAIILKSDIDEFIALLDSENKKNSPSALLKIFANYEDKGPEFHKQNMVQNKIVVSWIERLNLIKHQVRLAELQSIN